VLDKNGFKRKTYDDLLTDMSAKAKELFGANANVTERAVLGILIRIMAWFLSLAWMAIEQVYHAAYRKSAEGVQLDKLLPLAGTTRNLDEYAFGEVTLTGTPNYTVGSGFLVGTEYDVNFETLEDVTLDVNGQGTVEIVCTEIGPIGNVEANSITEIVQTNADVISVTNVNATSGGRNKETDQEARERSDITVEGQGSGTTASVRAELLKIPAVRAARVIENYEDVPDEFGTPSRAIQAFVLGGSDEDIAQAILNKKAGGIRPHGAIFVNIPDLSGDLKKIGFTRATEVNLFARVTVTKNTSFQSDGIDQVKNALVKYVGGADTTNQLYAGLNMGEKVYFSQSIKAITMNVAGIVDVDIEFSTDGVTYSSSNIDIAINEVAQISADDIEVTVNV
jgi:uncharacterized phage protein gp47/JayE